MRAIDGRYRTIRTGAGRGLGGLSEGGYASLNIGFHHPTEFHLLESWSDSYTYRANEIASYVAPERITRRYMAELARAAAAEERRYAFTLNAGVSLVAPNFRVPVLHCYLEGDPAPLARALGLRAAAEADGTLHVLAPYDPGVFYGALEKGGLKVVCLPQLYADLVNYERRGREQAEHLRREAMGY